MQISRNLFQYYSADSKIVMDIDDVDSTSGNQITVACGARPAISSCLNFPINLGADGIITVNYAGCKSKTYEHQEGLGAVYLRPKGHKRLETVVWGFDPCGLRLASRLLPTLTGSGQPEFIIVRKACAWRGAAGVLAMGSFDSEWKVSANSFLE